LDKYHLIFMTGLLFALSLTACLPEDPPFVPSTVLTPTPFSTNTTVPTSYPTPPLNHSTTSPEATVLPLSTSTPVPSLSPTSAPTPSPIPVLVSPDTVNVPILLYHHIADFSGSGQEYYVGVQSFQDQMQRLKDWGYTTITISDLAEAIHTGGPLPVHPIVITFDDGNLDVYQNALPILNQFGFKAVIYVIVNYLGSNENVSVAQVQEMAAHGWEIGSHSYTHTSLLKSENLQKEICLSRYNLAKLTGLEVHTFAYPFGLADQYVTQFARDCGYSSAAGLGPSYRQSADNLFYLNRLTVLNGWSLADFSSYLPWRSP